MSDAELLRSLDHVMKRSREATADLLVHLGEVEARRLYLAASCSSMFVYCTQRLGFDEGAAYNRIAASRQARRFPIILEMVADGRLHLTGICLLAAHLTVDNHMELLDAAVGRSKRAIERLLADRQPMPPVKSRIRRLPEAAKPEARQEPLELAPAAASVVSGEAAVSGEPVVSGEAVVAGEPRHAGRPRASLVRSPGRIHALWRRARVASRAPVRAPNRLAPPARRSLQSSAPELPRKSPRARRCLRAPAQELPRKPPSARRCLRSPAPELPRKLRHPVG